jgi:hypothetical protein
MKGVSVRDIVHEQLANANATIRVLTTRIEELLASAKERDARIDELIDTIKSLEAVLAEKNVNIQNIEGKLRGLSSLLNKKSEKQSKSDEAANNANTTADATANKSQKVAKDGQSNSVAKKSRYDNAKSRGNNGAKRDFHIECEEEVVHLYPEEPGFDMNLARELNIDDKKQRVVYRYELVPMSFKKIKYIIHKFTQDGKIYQGKAPMTPLLNSSYDGSFIAGLAQLRYFYSMSVERIIKYFNDNGFVLKKATAHKLLKRGTDLLENLYKCLANTIRQDNYLFMDETWQKVLTDEENKNGKMVRNGYIWGAISYHSKLAYYFYDSGSRSEEILFDFIRDYSGTIQSDGFKPYRKLGGECYPNILRIACLQHCKRRFLNEGSPRAMEIVRLINKLYQNDHKHKIGVNGWAIDKNLKWRQKFAPPILNEIHRKLLALKEDPEVLPRTPLYEAVTYMLNEWRDIPSIFANGEYQLDTNTIERFNRYVSIARRNSLFFGSHKGAERGIIYLSLACSCRMHGVNFFDYISDVLNRTVNIPPTAPPERYRDLLPDRWKPSPTSES